MGAIRLSMQPSHNSLSTPGRSRVPLYVWFCCSECDDNREGYHEVLNKADCHKSIPVIRTVAEGFI